MLSKIFHYIGKRSSRRRKIIHKLTGKWYWGIISWIKAHPTEPENYQDNTPEWLDKHLNQIFSLPANQILKTFKDLAKGE